MVDFNGSIDAIRILIPDVEPVFGENKDENLFTDDEIAAIFNSVGNSSIMRTAGLLMITVGNSEALIGKVITTEDLSTDASKLQATWKANGAYYIGLADSEDVATADLYFNIVDYRPQLRQPELTELWEDTWGY